MPQDISRSPADVPKRFGQTWVLRQGTAGKLMRAACGHLLRMASFSVTLGNGPPPLGVLESYSSRSCRSRAGQGCVPDQNGEVGSLESGSEFKIPALATYWCGLGQITYPP